MPGDIIQRLEFNWETPHSYGAFGGPGSYRKGTFTVKGASLEIAVTIDKKPHPAQTINLPPGCIVTAEFTLFKGFLVSELAQAGGQCIPVFTCRPMLPV
jgi:hypothetical protein